MGPAECPGGSECGVARCIEGACFLVADPAVCTAGACHPVDGCLESPIDGGIDASMDGGPDATGDAEVDAPDGGIAPRVDWAKRFGGGGDETLLSVAVMPDDGAVIAGGFRDTVNFGNGPEISEGQRDAVVLALHADGTTRFAPTFGSTGDDYATDVIADSTGNVFFVGGFEGSIDFGGGPRTSLGSIDAFIASLDISTGHRFSNAYGGAGFQHATSIGFGIRGPFFAAVFFTELNYGSGLAVGDMIDTMLGGLTPGFVEDWNMPPQISAVGGRATESRATVDAAGNIYVTGWFDGTLGGVATAGDRDIFVRSYTQRGIERWRQTFGGTAEDQLGMLTPTPTGIAFVGWTHGTLTIGEDTLVSSDRSGILVGELDAASGDPLWARIHESDGGELLRAVTSDADGNLYACGWFNGGAGVSGARGTGMTNDVLIVSFDPAGAVRWAHTFPGTGDDLCWGIARSELGTIYASGTYTGAIDFGEGPLMADGGSRDMFVVRLVP